MRELEDYFKALADGNRLRIMNLLLHGELCVCDIQRVLEAPQPNVSRHLAYLKHSGLALDRRDGLRMFYRLADSSDRLLESLFEFLRRAFSREKRLQDDVRRLRQAIQAGHCTMTGWHPYSALERPPRQEQQM
jgi:ArsR family transcriptional regulator